MSDWHAVEAIDEALEDTKEMLLPFDLGTWTKLAVIAVLAGGVGAPNFFMPGGYSDGHDGNTEMNTQDFGMTGAFMTGSSLQASIAVAAVLALVGLVFLIFYISSVFEFIYYRSLLDGEAHIRRYFSQNTGRGLSYFGFRLAAGLVVLLGVLAVIGVSFVTPLFLLPALLVGLPLLLAFGVFMTLVHDFALVDMLRNDSSMLEAVTKVLEAARDDWRQFGLYVVLKFFIAAIVGVATFLFAIFSLLFLAIPFVILGIAASTVFKPLIIPVIIAGVLTWVIGMIYIVTVPAKTFTYFYALDVYSRLFE
ncbi:MAG: hypothetical protein ABEJ98_04690 [Candidatus Nanohaloarchaea archaeon]